MVTAKETPPAAESSVLATALSQFDAAADRLGLDSGMRQVLRHCKRELSVNFPVKMDDGSLRVFNGYRVQHNLARGPAKGGLRYNLHVSLDEVRALAMWMTWKSRRRQPALRRRQGWSHRRPQVDLPARAGGADPPLRH